MKGVKKVHLVALAVSFLSVVGVDPAQSLADDSTGTSILVIGDSHSAGAFGKNLDKDLRTAFPKADVSFYAASSATPDYYYYGTSSHGGFYEHFGSAKVVESSEKTREQPTPKLPDLLSRSHATVTVVALSTNLLRGSLDNAREQILRTIKTVKDTGSQCIWVGGPDERFVSREMQESLYRVLEAATEEGGCRLIDSRKYTHYPDGVGGGIHYDDIWARSSNGGQIHVGATMAAEWADKVTTEIAGIMNGPSGTPGEPAGAGGTSAPAK
jgi:hypothetical protein